MKAMKDHFLKVSASLRARADLAGGTGHGATTGKLREVLIKEFLTPSLPRHFEIRAGVVIDSEGRKSPQQDVLIVDNRFPLIDLGSNTDAVFMAESVAAVVEVKSSLDKERLLESLRAIADVKGLKRTGCHEYRKGPARIEMPEAHPILGYIFAFDGTEPTTLIEHVVGFVYPDGRTPAYNQRQVVDAVCVLDRGVMLRDAMVPSVSGNSVTLPKTKGPQLLAVPCGADALLQFYRRMLTDLTYLRLVGFDLDPYFSE